MQNQEVTTVNCGKILRLSYSLGIYFIGMVCGCAMTLLAMAIIG